ncbi:MAG TPA: hypothetical protein VK733_05305 [Gemmatimonadaceae bacterium]|jgi:hypothetical protein|nr:hypothetical protein [Gemmatimonadaceae bacterium]
MTELPDDIRRALAELPRERQPDPALEDRVVGAVFPRRRGWAWAGVAAAAAVLLLVVAHPWSRPKPTGDTYALLLMVDSTYSVASPAELRRREHEYGLWADSLAALGKLDLAGKLVGHGELPVDGLFIIRAANDADAERIALTCPHYKYHGRIEVRRYIQ